MLDFFRNSFPDRDIQVLSTQGSGGCIFYDQEGKVYKVSYGGSGNYYDLFHSTPHSYEEFSGYPLAE